MTVSVGKNWEVSSRAVLVLFGDCSCNYPSFIQLSVQIRRYRFSIIIWFCALFSLFSLNEIFAKQLSSMESLGLQHFRYLRNMEDANVNGLAYYVCYVSENCVLVLRLSSAHTAGEDPVRLSWTTDSKNACELSKI